MAASGAQEKKVYEFIPEPAAVKAPPTAPRIHAAREGMDERSSPNPRDIQAAFAKRVAASGDSGGFGHRREFETLGGGQGIVAFEPPEQKVAKLQAEVADLLHSVEGNIAKTGPNASSDLFGANPADVASELKVLERRLAALSSEGPAVWRKGQGKMDGGKQGPMSMPGSLVEQLERLASGVPGVPASGADSQGRVTYELTYAPSASHVADSSKIAALESLVAEIEKKLGIPDPNCPFLDLHTAVAQLHKRVASLDASKLDAIRQRVKTVSHDIERMLEKKAELEGTGRDRDEEIDQKVNDLYDFCHRWNAAAAALPTVVARLRSLQALHQQSTSFASRLNSLEQQQEELHRVLETTSTAVKELGVGLQENMKIVQENMRTLEAKVAKALKQ